MTYKTPDSSNWVAQTPPPFWLNEGPKDTFVVESATVQPALAF